MSTSTSSPSRAAVRPVPRPLQHCSSRTADAGGARRLALSPPTARGNACRSRSARLRHSWRHRKRHAVAKRCCRQRCQPHAPSRNVVRCPPGWAAVGCATCQGGFIASETIKQLLEQGYHVKGTARKAPGEQHRPPLRPCWPSCRGARAGARVHYRGRARPPLRLASTSR